MAALEFRGKHWEFLHDTTPEISLEGSRNCGKTIVWLWKELEALKQYPGMWSYLGRYSDDSVKTLLRPELERVASIHGTDLSQWNREENYYELKNGGRIFSFGLKTVSPDPDQRYKKIRGLSVSRIGIDQAEELPGDIASELRFPLRANIAAKVKGMNYPKQLIFIANPADTDSWLAAQFPTNNKLKGRRYYSLSLFDNEHNLDPGTIESLLLEFPPEHPKNLTLIQGQRGPTIIGDAVYDKVFDREVHKRPLAYREDADVLEAFEVGKHNPFWIAAQRTYYGGLHVLAGIKGDRLMLEDFLPIVKRYRAEWFPRATFKSCASPIGEKPSSELVRMTPNQILRSNHFDIHTRPTANDPAVKIACIEQIAGLLRRRVSMGEEAFGVSSDPARWLVASRDGIHSKPFMAYALDGGYVWSEQWVSLSHDKIRKPKDDDDYANAMKALENIVLNFCFDVESESESLERRRRAILQAGEDRPEHPLSWMTY